MRLLFFVTYLILLSGCATTYVKQSYSPVILFTQAQVELNKGNTRQAVSLLKQLETNYIFSAQAIEAQVLLIYIYYSNNELDEAEVIASSFLKYFPFNQYTPWVEYMYALIIAQETPYKKRDITKAYLALSLFKDYINKYPDSDYSKDLMFRLPLIRNIIANRSMEIGNFYLKHKVYIGAINRFKEVLDNYNDSIFVPEALYRMIYSFTAMGLHTEALEYYELLKLNYSNSVWYNLSKRLIEYQSTIQSNKG